MGKALAALRAARLRLTGVAGKTFSACPPREGPRAWRAGRTSFTEARENAPVAFYEK